MPCKAPHLLHYGLLCRINLSSLDAGNSQQFHSTSSGKQAWIICQTTNTRYKLSEVPFLPFIEPERRVRRYEKPDTKSKGAMHSLRRVDTFRLQCAKMSRHCTGTFHTVLKCTKQTRPFCVRAACCKLLSAALSERKAVCLFSHL